MPQQEILCTVSNCYYNEAGKKCIAEKIQVVMDAHAMGGGKMEVGGIGEAGNSAKTACQTFVPKQQGPKPGVGTIKS